MIDGLWRNIHFLLAITASLFLIIAALSGAILVLEAAWYTTRPQAISLSEISLGEAKQKIETQFEEVYEIELNSEGFLLVQGSAKKQLRFFLCRPEGCTNLRESKKAFHIFSVCSQFTSLFIPQRNRTDFNELCFISHGAFGLFWFVFNAQSHGEFLEIIYSHK